MHETIKDKGSFHGNDIMLKIYKHTELVQSVYSLMHRITQYELLV